MPTGPILSDDHGLGIVPARLASAALITLTYVSKTRILAEAMAAEMASLVASTRERNDDNVITGGLLFTGQRFVQTLEGKGTVVAALMVVILQDKHHDGLCVIEVRAIAVRRFPLWSLVYSGPSVFVAEAVARGLSSDRPGQPRDVARLLRLIMAFSRERASPPA